METVIHLGKKLEKIAEARGLKPRDVAHYFGIKPPSVYDWYQNGRIAKKHYDKLVEFSGKPITWWLDMKAPQPPSVQEARPGPFLVDDSSDWPFTLVTAAEWFSLDEKTRHEFENSIVGAVARARQTAVRM